MVAIQAIRRQLDDVEDQIVSHAQAHHAEPDELLRLTRSAGTVVSDTQNAVVNTDKPRDTSLHGA